MAKLTGLSNLKDIVSDIINDMENKFTLSIKQIKLEYNKNIVEEKVRLLKLIAHEENLNFDKLKLKYLKPKEIKLLTKTINDENNLEILDKIVIDNKDYYYDRINNLLYNTESNLIGSLDINKEIIFK